MSAIVPIMLGSQAASGQLVRQVWPWLGLLALVVIVGGVVVMIVRRYMYGSTNAVSEGFTLYDLRKLREAGELSDDEYEAARVAMIGRMTSDARTVECSDNPPGSGGGDQP